MTNLNFEEIEQKIPDVVEFVREFKHLQWEEKKRGINDANTFTTLLFKSDEVRLHSRFLRFLLDPQGNHYQEDLFLRLFLKCVGLSDFGLNTARCDVEKEYENIDLYITDGNKHIILENKIWAPDQEKQLQRYIKSIQQPDTNPDNIAVIYLSPDGKEPSEYSLGEEYRISHCKKFIESEKYKYHYRQLSYEIHIIQWLESIHTEIAHITNLSVMIEQYIEVVQKITGKYEEKIMGFYKYVKDKNKADLIEDLECLNELYAEETNKILKKFWEKVEENIKCKLGSEYPFSPKYEKLKHDKRGGTPVRIEGKKEPYLAAEYICDNQRTDTDNGIKIKHKGIAIKYGILNDENCWWNEENDKPKIYPPDQSKSLTQKIADEGVDAVAKGFADAFYETFKEVKSKIS